MMRRIRSSARCSTRPSASCSSTAKRLPRGPGKGWPPCSNSSSLPSSTSLFRAITRLGAILGRKLCASLFIIFIEPALGSLKLADAAADGFADLRQLSRSKNDERQHQDDNQFSGTDVSKHARFSF